MEGVVAAPPVVGLIPAGVSDHLYIDIRTLRILFHQCDGVEEIGYQGGRRDYL